VAKLDCCATHRTGNLYGTLQPYYVARQNENTEQARAQFLLGLYRILATAKNRPLLQIQPKSDSGHNVAGFQFLAGFAKSHTQILQCSVFQLVLKNCAVDVATFLIGLFTLLRSHHHLNNWWDLVLWILHAYCKYPSSLRCFINKSQIRPRLALQNLNPVQPHS